MGGKSSAPAAPDYVGQANATAAGNLDVARMTTAANRVDQSTPYGDIKYTQGDGFDQGGYDAAVKQYQATQAAFGDPNNAQMQQYVAAGGKMPAAPSRDQFITNPDHWTSNIQLSDTGQQLLDSANQTQLGLAGLQGSAMNRVAAAQSQPFDVSGLQAMQTNVDPSTGMDAWTKATDLVRQRQNPQLDQQQADLDTKLANQGLTAGSEGWGIQQQNFGKTRNDADIAAQLAGLQAQQQFYGQAVQNAGLKNSSRQQQIQEQAFLRQQPLNELNALRTGAQVTNPTFANAPQQGQTQGADLLGATNQQYQAALGQTNANNAAAGQTTQALGSAAAMAAAYFF